MQTVMPFAKLIKTGEVVGILFVVVIGLLIYFCVGSIRRGNKGVTLSLGFGMTYFKCLQDSLLRMSTYTHYNLNLEFCGHL